MSTATDGRDLLFGLLAVQNRIIDREALVDALQRRTVEPGKPIDSILVDGGALSPALQGALSTLVEEHIRRHGGDPESSLAAFETVAPAADEPAPIAERDAFATVATFCPTDDSVPPSGPAVVGVSTSTGSRFQVLRLHAKGGIGQVSLAIDRELDRPVALKEIRGKHADDPASRARFVQEGQITGKLEHPGIVPVYGLGHDSTGRPFYAMRFIQGDSFEDAIQAFHADPSARKDPTRLRNLLRRFTDACNAIAYAHNRGVLHRDLKPANIMLGPYGETLVVDWGLAKTLGSIDPEATEPESIEGPLWFSTSGQSSTETVAGHPIGTPAYASPEQATGSLARLGPATDIYGLGATLYKLLTGRMPVEERDMQELLRRVETGQIPPPRSIDPTIPGPLEAICLKAMATRPEDRYASAKELGAEVTRWLDDEPVSAYREPISVRAGRWMRRNRTAMIAAAAATLVGTVGLAVVAAMKTRYAGELEETLERSGAVLDFLKKDVLAAARPEGQEGGLGVGVTVRQAIDAAEPKIAERFRDQPLVEADVRDVLGMTYYYLRADALAIRQHERAVEIRRAELGPHHRETLASRSHLATAYQGAGRPDEAIRLHESTLQVREQELGPDDPETLASRANLATAYQEAGRVDEAIQLLESTLARCEEKLGPDHPETLDTRNNLASAYHDRGRYDEAIKLLEETAERLERRLGADHPDTLTVRGNLAASYYKDGRLDDALAILETNLKRREKELGPDHHDTLTSRANLAATYYAAGRVDEAIGLLEAALKARESALGAGHAETLAIRDDLAAIFGRLHRFERAEPLLRAGLSAREKAHPDAWTTFQARSLLGANLLARKKFAEAEPLLLSGYEGMKAREARIPGESKPRLAEAAERITWLYEEWGKPDKAAEWRARLPRPTPAHGFGSVRN